MTDSCADCPMRTSATARARHRIIVPPEPARTPRGIAIVGEGPGHEERAEGRPFIGRTGRAMMQALSSIGLRRRDCHWTNAVLCSPPPDAMRAAQRACQGRVTEELAGHDYVIAAGAWGLRAATASRKSLPILRWRGTVNPQGEGGDRTLLPILHPAFVMRAPAWRRTFADDVKRIGRVMREGFVPPEEHPAHRIVVARTIRDLHDALGRLRPGAPVGFDVETVGLGPTVTALVCFALSDGAITIVVPWARKRDGSDPWWGRYCGRVADAVSECLRTRTTVTHNGPAFDHIVAERYGIRIGDWDDTLLATHVLESHLPKGLGHVVTTRHDVSAWKEWEDRNADLPRLWTYNARDTLYTLLAWTGSVTNQPPLQTVREGSLYGHDKVSAEICRDMTVAGFAFDTDRAQAMADFLQKQEALVRDRADEAAGFAIRRTSSGGFGDDSLRQAFFGELRAPVYCRSELTGRPSLGVDALRAYAAAHDDRLRDLSLAVLEWRRLRKVRSTYVLGPRPQADGRVRPSWLSSRVVSGRWSCQGPNLMNLPRRDNDPAASMGGVRSLYCAPEGRVLVDFDASQLEMRIAAYASGDEAMIAACESSDLHAANAETIFGAHRFTAEEYASAEGQRKAVLKAVRSMAKNAGFAVCYMASAETVYARLLADGQDVRLRDCEGMLANMRNSFAQYYRWQSDRLLDCIRRGYVETPILGRRRYLGHDPSPTEAANFPIQGGAADLMNIKVPAIVDELRARIPDAFPVAQVHDSCIIECDERDAEDVSAVARSIFEAPVRIGGRDASFPIEIDVRQRWA